MVFGSICEYTSSVFIFASTRTVQIYLASSEHIKDRPKIEIGSNEHFINFLLSGISLLWKRKTILREIIWMTP